MQSNHNKTFVILILRDASDTVILKENPGDKFTDKLK